MWGIIAGLMAACFQSISYIFSRSFVIKHKKGAFRLLLTSHVWMGIMSISVFSLLPFKNKIPSFSSFSTPLLLASFFYILGQASLFMMMRHVPASRIAPLLGLKILILAVITFFFIGEKLFFMQWMAVAMSLISAFLLNFSGVSLSFSAISWLMVACIGYSLSDINIAILVRSISTLSYFKASVVGVCLSYVFCGILALLILLLTGKIRIYSEWKDSFGFAFFWFASMIMLFTCFGTIGALYGNIVQATRGIISIIIGVILARIGYMHIETPISGRLFFQRIIAALLMIIAIGLFNLGKQ